MKILPGRTTTRHRIAAILVTLLISAAGFGQQPGYHEPLPAKVTDLEDRAWKILDARIGKDGYGTEGALVWASRDLCDLVDEATKSSSGSDLVLDSNMVEGALLGRGITDTRVHPFVVAATDEALALESFTGHVEADPAEWDGRIVGIGSGQYEGRVMLCAVTVHKGVILDPFPRKLDVPGKVALAGKILEGIDSVRVVVANPQGDVVEVPVTLTAKGFVTTVGLDDGQGVYVLEVLGTSSFGPEVLNLFPVTVGKAGGIAHVVLSVPWRAGPGRNAWMLFDLVNADRLERGLAKLEPDHELAQAALAHSRDMRDGGFFGHVSPTHGGFDKRTAHITGITDAGEAIALASSPQRAFANLMNSPAHAAALRSAKMTSMGVGKVKTDEGMLFTVIVALRDP